MVGQFVRTQKKSLAGADRRLFLAVSRWKSPALDVVMPLLSRAANKSVLWIVVAAGMSALPSRREGEAARRGLASVAVTSLVANQVGKRLSHRARPDRSSLPVVRRLLRVPSSTSFPSGHAASAAAFAVGVAIDDPALAIPVGALAGAVGFSRIYEGMHYPGDVLAGAALGAGIAGLGGIVFLPPGKSPPPDPSSLVSLPPRPTGAGVSIIVNPHAGGGRARTLPTWLSRQLPDAKIVLLDQGGDPSDALRRAAEQGAEVLGVAGGDGSLSAGAAVAIERNLPLLGIPAGTLNHFARDLGLDGPPDAIAACQSGTALRIDVGELDGDIFVNTASMGSYPAFVASREKWERWIGKGLATVIAANDVVRAGGDLLTIETDGKQRTIAALFVGAGRYDPPGGAPARRDHLDSGVLDIRFVQVHANRGRLDSLRDSVSGPRHLRSPFGRYEKTEMDVTITGQTLLARDGEVAQPTSNNVALRIKPRALTVYRPAGS